MTEKGTRKGSCRGTSTPLHLILYNSNFFHWNYNDSSRLTRFWWATDNLMWIELIRSPIGKVLCEETWFSYLFFTLSGNYTRLVLQFELRRNVLYFILETYVPSTFLVVLSWVSFWISLDSVPARTCIGKHLQQEISKNWGYGSFFVSFCLLPVLFCFFTDIHRAVPGVGFLRHLLQRKRQTVAFKTCFTVIRENCDGMV